MRKIRVIYAVPFILVILGAYMQFRAHQLNVELDSYFRSMPNFVYVTEYWPKYQTYRRYAIASYAFFYVALVVSSLLLAFNWNKRLSARSD